MRRALHLMLCMLMIFSSFSFLISMVSADADLRVVSSSYWPDRASPWRYFLTGEIENIGDSPAGFVWINVTFFDSDDTVLFCENNLGVVSMGVILPEHKAPFVIYADLYASSVDHYSFEINYQTVEPIPIGLELVSSNKSLGENDKLIVSGEVKNIGSYTAISPWIHVTYYDSDGIVVNMLRGATTPQDIEPNQTASFTIESPWWYGIANEQVESYAITAVCDQYVLIPEFPAIAFIPLFLMSTLIVIMVYRKIPKNKNQKMEKHVIKAKNN